MKFEKFIKRAVPYCVTVMNGGEAWCKAGKMYARIPSYIGQIGMVDKNDVVLKAALDGQTGGKAELIKAYILNPDGKSKDIIRQFSDGDYSFNIKNENFGLIERYDDCYIAEVESDTVTGYAMLVGKPTSDPDNFEPDLIFVDVVTKEKEK